MLKKHIYRQTNRTRKECHTVYFYFKDGVQKSRYPHPPLQDKFEFSFIKQYVIKELVSNVLWPNNLSAIRYVRCLDAKVGDYSSQVEDIISWTDLFSVSNSYLYLLYKEWKWF